MAATVVTADGRVVRAGADEHPDLFWGLRGGGGNFGVVTEFEFALYPVGPIVATTVAIWPIDEAAAVLRDFRDLAPTLPDEVSPVAVLSPVPDDEAFPATIRGGDALFILAMAAAPLDEGAELVRPIAALGPGAAVDIGGPTPYVEFQQFFDADYPAHTMRYYWKSSFADDLTDGPSTGSSGRSGAGRPPLDDRHLGQPRRDLARLQRRQRVRPARAAWLMSPESNWEWAADDAANLAWGRDIVDAIGGSAYLNFPGLLEEGERSRRRATARPSSGCAVKAAWDPENVFRFNANIPPAAPG